MPAALADDDMGTALFMVVKVDPEAFDARLPDVTILCTSGFTSSAMLGASLRWPRNAGLASTRMQPFGAAQPRYGSTKGRLLTPQEREMLNANTEAFLARMEQEAAEEDARTAAAEAKAMEVRRRAAELASERHRDLQRRADLDAPWVPPEDRHRRRVEPSANPAQNPLELYRAQQAALAARSAIARLPALGGFHTRLVEEAIVDAKADYVARGLILDEPGSRQRIEAKALELLVR